VTTDTLEYVPMATWTSWHNVHPTWALIDVTLGHPNPIVLQGKSG